MIFTKFVVATLVVIAPGKSPTIQYCIDLEHQSAVGLFKISRFAEYIP